LEPIDETIAPLTAPDHVVTPLDRSELFGLIGQPPLRHTYCAIAVWAHPKATLGPLAGHYARRMPVIQGQLRAVPDDSSPACRRSGRDLPSWPCEFDSRHPLHMIAPSQIKFQRVQVFEQSDNKKGWTGHPCFLIIGARYLPKCLVRRDFTAREPGPAEVDHARCRAQFVPNTHELRLRNRRSPEHHDPGLNGLAHR
jgi:hypothetical protein